MTPLVDLIILNNDLSLYYIFSISRTAGGEEDNGENGEHSLNGTYRGLDSPGCSNGDIRA